MLEFTKEGFNPGHFPLEVTPDDASGGSVSYERPLMTPSNFGMDPFYQETWNRCRRPK